jgi:hypothetical protein
VWQLYHASHSLEVFGVVFGVVWLVARRPVFVLFGWAFHIAFDILTHRGMFATHSVADSFSGLDGSPEEDNWFLLANYSVLALILVLLWIGKRRSRNAKKGLAAAPERLWLVRAVRIVVLSGLGNPTRLPQLPEQGGCHLGFRVARQKSRPLAFGVVHQARVGIDRAPHQV